VKLLHSFLAGVQAMNNDDCHGWATSTGERHHMKMPCKPVQGLGCRESKRHWSRQSIEPQTPCRWHSEFKPGWTPLDFSRAWHCEERWPGWWVFQCWQRYAHTFTCLLQSTRKGPSRGAHDGTGFL